jgi:hypothetical protein
MVSLTPNNQHLKTSNTIGILAPTHFEKSVKMRLALSKWELGSPLGLSKLQSLIAGVKTPHIEAFFISLKIYRSVNVENGLT